MNLEKLFNKKHIIFDSKAKTQDEAFSELANLAEKLHCINNKQNLITAFKIREKESSTALEGGFAVPHARLKTITKPAVLFIRYINMINWNNTNNEEKVNVTIALLIPEANPDNSHLTILSNIARKLINENVRKQLKIEKNKEKIAELLFKQPEAKVENKTDDKKLILAMTSCPVGIAHTYLAADKLQITGAKLGYNIKVETHGAEGVRNVFTNDEISTAEVIIVASDTGLDLSRFAGKKIYNCSVAQAIKTPETIIHSALKEGKKQKEIADFTTNNNQKITFMKHLMTGVSYMVPLVILGGIFIAFSEGLSKAIYGVNLTTDPIANNYNFLYYTRAIGVAAFTLMIPILGAFIANSIAGRAAIAPALVVSYIANSPNYFFPLPGINEVKTPTGFLGAIGVGLAIGYTVKWINTLNTPKAIKPLMPIFVIPIVVGFVYSMIMMFVVGSCIGWIMNKLSSWINNTWGNINNTSNIAISLAFGLLIGAMAGFDMGGPINKIAFLTCTGLINNKIYTPMGAMTCAIPVAPLGMGITTWIFKPLFSREEKTLGTNAFIMGCIGISEGAIPFAINDPKKVITCNVIGSSLAGGLAGLLGIANVAGHGGPIVGFLGALGHGNKNDAILGWAGAWSYTLVALIIMFACALLTACMYGFWLLVTKKNEKQGAFLKNNGY